VIRVALDRQRVGVARDVSTSVWEGIEELVHRKGRLVLSMLGESTELTYQLSGDYFTANGDQLWLRVRRPGPATDTKRRSFPVEYEVRGLACARTSTGLDAVRSARTAVEALLYPDVERAELATRTFPGRFDVALDINVRGAGAAAWVERELFKGGDLDAARADWSTRARTQKTMRPDDGDDDTAHNSVRMQGCERRGRTLYLGSAPSELCVYDKLAHQNDGLDVVRSTWASLGWNGEGEVIRAELRAHRAWFRDQVFSLDGVDVRGHTLTLDEFLAHLPSIAAVLFKRFRHCDGPALRRHDRARPTSTFWQAACASLGRLLTTKASRPVSIKSVKRTRAIERAVQAACNAIVDLKAIGGPGGAPLSEPEAFALVWGRLRDPRYRPSFDARAERVKRRYSEVAATVLATPSNEPDTAVVFVPDVEVSA
jgi:hypothetical protein